MSIVKRIGFVLLGFSVGGAAIVGCAGDAGIPDEIVGVSAAELASYAAPSPAVLNIDGLLRPRLSASAALLLKKNAVDVALKLGPVKPLDLTAYDRARTLVRQRLAGGGVLVVTNDIDAVTLLWAVDAVQMLRVRLQDPSEVSSMTAAQLQALASAYQQAQSVAESARHRMDESLSGVSQKIG